MRLEQFEYINAVYKYGSMNDAANKLHVSQQNISKSIKQVEDAMRVKIFGRSKKGCIPTEEGEIICQFAEKQVAAFHAMKENLIEMQREKLAGKLTIYTMNSGSCMIIPEMLCNFYKNYPNVNLEIVDTNLNGVLDKVSHGNADLGIVTICKLKHHEYPEISGNLQIIPLIMGEWCFWVSEDSGYAHKGFITLEEANKESILSDSSIDLDVLKEIFSLCSLKINLGMNVRSLHLLGTLIMNGRGVFPDMQFKNGDSMFGYALENQGGIVLVPVKGALEYTGVACLVEKKKKRDSLLIHTLDVLNNFSAEEGRI